MSKAKEALVKGKTVNVAIVGANGVGKSSWARVLFNGAYTGNYTGYYNQWSDEPSSRLHPVEVDGEVWNVEMHDLVLKPLWAAERDISINYWDKILSQLHGVILLYDVTDRKSYDSVTKADYPTILSFRERHERTISEHNSMDEEIYWGRFHRFGGLLVGNKVDKLVTESSSIREVPQSLAQEWASMHGMKHFEGHSFDQEWSTNIVAVLIRQIIKAELRDKEDAEQRERHEAVLRSHETSVAQKSNGRNRFSTFSKSFSKMRNALPRVPLKTGETAGTGQPTEEEEPQWNMFLPSTQP